MKKLSLIIGIVLLPFVLSTTFVRLVLDIQTASTQPRPLHEYTDLPITTIPIRADNASRIQPLLRIGNGFVKGINWSPNRRNVAINSTIGVWIGDTKNVQTPLIFLTQREAKQLSFSLDGKLFGILEGGRLSFWDTSLWQPATTVSTKLTTESVDVSIFAFGPDTRSIVLIGTDGMVTIYDIDTGKLVSQGSAGKGLDRINFSKDGLLLAVWSSNALAILNASTGVQIYHQEFLPYTELVRDVVFTRDSLGIILNTMDLHESFTHWNTVSAIDLFPQSPSPIVEAVNKEHHFGFGSDGLSKVHSNPQGDLALYYDTWSSQGRPIDGSKITEPFVVVWIGSDPHEIRVAQNVPGIRTIQLSTDSQKLALTTEKTTQLWDIQTQQKLVEFPAIQAFNDDLSSAILEQDDSLLLWDTLKNTEIGRWRDFQRSLGNYSEGRLKFDSTGTHLFADYIALSPDDRLLLGWQSLTNPQLVLWDRQQGQVRQVIPREFASIKFTAFSPDSQQLVIMDHDVIYLWKADENSIKTLYREPSCERNGILYVTCHSITSISFSPNNKYLLASTAFLDRPEESMLRLWDTTSLQEQHLLVPASVIQKVIFSPDSRQLAVMSISRES